MSVISSIDETGSSPVQTAILREAFLNRKASLFFVLNLVAKDSFQNLGNNCLRFEVSHFMSS
jgi:hypothetical protein